MNGLRAWRYNPRVRCTRDAHSIEARKPGRIDASRSARRTVSMRRSSAGAVSEGNRTLRRFRRLVRNGAYRVLHTLTGPGRGVRVILLYHSVGTDEPHGIPPAAFREQMQILSRGFRIVRLCDLKGALTSTPTDANLACVTFDDGIRDNYECALPILEAFGIKGTFFVVSGLLGKSPPSRFGHRPRMTASQV